jgi:hypothetical protein
MLYALATVKLGGLVHGYLAFPFARGGIKSARSSAGRIPAAN